MNSTSSKSKEQLQRQKKEEVILWARQIDLRNRKRERRSTRERREQGRRGTWKD